MKKKIQALYILLALIVLFSVGIVLCGRTDKKQQTAGNEESEPVQVTDISVADIGALAVTNDKGTFGLMIYGDSIELIPVDDGKELEFDAAAVDLGEMRAFVYAVCHMNADRQIESDGKLAEYGYESPKSTVKLFKNNGDTVELKLLNPGAFDGAYYLYSEENGSLYLVDKSTADFMLRSAADFMNHSLFPEIGSANLNSLESITLKTVDGSGFEIENKGGVFFLSDPIEQRLRTSLIYSNLAAPLGAIYGTECIQVAGDTSAFGFDSADCRVDMRFSGEEYSVAFCSNEDGYLMADMNSGMIYSISKDEYNSFSKDYMELLGGTPFYYSLADCRSIRISSADREAYYEVSGTGESMTLNCDGEILDAEKAVSISSLINGVRISGPLATEVNGDPELTIVFTLTGGSNETVEFIKLENSDNYAAVVNGKANFSVPGTDVQAILNGIFIENA